ncbi:MAG TPA: type II toxin-antitoxin system VapC family toxin [Rhodospirillales bacterium]|nr:type II toxin-antitoxin system VapC family toxin [Rhodospirillales bacterium]
MNGIDTNVLLRLLLRDDDGQARRADAFVERSWSQRAPCLVSHIVLVEAAWVLQSGYRYRRDQVAGIIDGILRTETFTVEGAAEVWAALADYRADDRSQGVDFADCLIGRTNAALGCERTATFDKAAAVLVTFQSI